jgi:hypothetical protein
MRFSRLPLFKFVACFAVLAFLLGVATAGAAEREGKASKEPREVQKPRKVESIYTGPYKGVPFFFKLQNVSDCSSSCCTAHASCNGAANTSCTETSCTATCPESGTTSTSPCRAVPQE